MMTPDHFDAEEAADEAATGGEADATGAGAASSGRGRQQAGDPTSPREVGRRTVYAGRKFDFEVVSLERPTKNAADGGDDGAADGPNAGMLEREMIRHPGAVCILPLVEAGDGLEVLLIRNHRFTVGRVLWELPAGGLEPGEEPEACAARELEEETGYRAEHVEHLAGFLTTPGVTDERMEAFVARGLREVGQALEEDEHITVHRVPAETALAMTRRGEIEDGKSMLTILLAADRGLLS
jgi:ADP-ribose pyrophosphatase